MLNCLSHSMYEHPRTIQKHRATLDACVDMHTHMCICTFTRHMHAHTTTCVYTSIHMCTHSHIMHSLPLRCTHIDVNTPGRHWHISTKA